MESGKRLQLESRDSEKHQSWTDGHPQGFT